MASKALSTTFPKLQSTIQAIRRRFGGMATYDEAAEMAKQGRDAAKKAGQQVINEAASAADDVAIKTKGMADKVSETAGKIKDAVVGKAESAAESGSATVREQAAKVERCMNSKNNST